MYIHTLLDSRPTCGCWVVSTWGGTCGCEVGAIGGGICGCGLGAIRGGTCGWVDIEGICGCWVGDIGGGIYGCGGIGHTRGGTSGSWVDAIF